VPPMQAFLRDRQGPRLFLSRVADGGKNETLDARGLEGSARPFEATTPARATSVTRYPGGESGEGISAAQERMRSEYLSLSGRVDALRTHSKEEMTRASTMLEGQRSITRVLLFVIVVSGVVFIALRALRRPVDHDALREVTDVAAGLAQGEVTKRVHVNSSDEIGAMGTALNGALDKVAGTIRTIAENANGLGTASEELTAVSQEMTGSADQTATQANAVSAAADQVSKNVHTVATAFEEMTASNKRDRAQRARGRQGRDRRRTGRRQHQHDHHQARRQQLQSATSSRSSLRSPSRRTSSP